jgi:hypothetical protein
MSQKITFEIPGLASDRRAVIFLGGEYYIVRESDNKVYRKIVRCDMCGECCRDPGLEWPLGIQTIDGTVYCGKVYKINNEFFCEAGSLQPVGCAREIPRKHLPHPECIIRYEEAE